MRRLATIPLALIAFCVPALAARYAVVNGQGSVVNVIEAGPGFNPGVGYGLIQSDAAQIGGAYANGVYTPPASAAVPTQPKTFTFLQFMALFTSAEQAAIATSTDSDVAIWRMVATGAQFIDPTDPRTAQGLGLLVAKGLITQDRANAISAAMQ